MARKAHHRVAHKVALTYFMASSGEQDCDQTRAHCGRNQDILLGVLRRSRNSYVRMSLKLRSNVTEMKRAFLLARPRSCRRKTFTVLVFYATLLRPSRRED